MNSFINDSPVKTKDSERFPLSGTIRKNISMGKQKNDNDDDDDDDNSTLFN